MCLQQADSRPSWQAQEGNHARQAPLDEASWVAPTGQYVGSPRAQQSVVVRGGGSSGGFVFLK